MHRFRSILMILAAALLSLTVAIGCGDDDDDGLQPDAGDQEDVGADVADVAEDAEEEDAAPDAEEDAAPDVEEDAAPDAMVDAAPDAADDAAADAAPDVGGVDARRDVPPGQPFSTGLGDDRTVASLSDAEKVQVCQSASDFLDANINTDAAIERSCIGSAISFASFNVVSGDNDELQEACRDFNQGCLEDPPQDILEDQFSVDPQECPFVQVDCPGEIGLLETCFDNLITYLNQRAENAPTCDDIVFNDFNQVVVLDAFQPDQSLLLPCLQFTQQCPIDISVPE